MHQVAFTSSSRPRRHWFLAAVPLLVAGDLLVARVWNEGLPAKLLELIVLADLALVLPALGYLCHHRSGSPKRNAVQALALGCAGIWAAGHVVPAEEQQLLHAAEWLRYVGLAGLAVVELRVLWLLVQQYNRLGKAHVAETLSDLTGMPRWVARLVSWEIGLWHRIAIVARSVIRKCRR